MPSPLRVAVIGAGAAGLAATKALIDVGADVVTLDRSQNPGGLWVRQNEGSPAYASLHLNTSKGRTEFADLPMPAHWPDYPSADHIAGYLSDYADTFGLRDHLRMGTTVAAVERDEEQGRWTVRTDHPDHPELTVDAVVVANGHNWDPKWPSPDYPGEFTGTQLHAHDYRTAEAFRGKRVLVVGMGNSAMDIAVDASHVAAAPVLLSARHGVHIVPKYLFGRPADATGGAISALPWRLRQRLAETMLRLAVGRPQDYGLPAPAGGLFQNHPTISDTILHRLTHGEVLPRPGIARFDGDRVVFSDGTSEAVDTVVWATGYRVSIPFLSAAWLGDDAEAMPLYRRVFHLAEPTLGFVGLMQSTGAALPVVEAQAKLYAAWLSGRYALPAADQQQRQVQRALQQATARWGQRRPAMRIDFDDYLADIGREIAAGERRAAAGDGITRPAARTTNTAGAAGTEQKAEAHR